METGLFFGSFNPVHIGHMAIANYIAEYSDVSEVWFIVSPHNPLKKKETLLADRDRLYLTELAIGDDPRFRVSDVEFKLTQPSYTVDTLAYLTDRYPSRSFTLIMGEDNLATLHKWKNAELLVKEYPIIVYPRLYKAPAAGRKLKEILDGAKDTKIDAPVKDNSETFSHTPISEGREASCIFPSAARKYISNTTILE